MSTDDNGSASVGGILVFIPTFNCATQVPRVVDKIRNCRLPIREILAVDNRSGDGSVEVLAASLRHVGLPYKVIVNAENYGLGGSHKVAFRYAIENNFDYCLVLHGDDQADIRDFEQVILSGGHQNAPCVLGARFGKGSQRYGYDRVRTLGNLALNLFLSVGFGQVVKDMGSGLNLYEVDSLRKGFYESFPNDLTFNVYMLIYALMNWPRLHFVPITWREEDQRSNARAVRQAMHIIALVIRARVFPQRVFETHAGATRRDYHFQIVACH